jgi:hypothetical protein
MLSLALVFDFINFQKILLSSFILIAIVRSYSYVAFLTNLLASVLASSYFVLFCGFLFYLYFFQSFLFFTSAILLSPFIQGVSYFLDIDLLSGMFSSYIIFNSSANLCHRLLISPWANFKFQSILFNCALIFS